MTPISNQEEILQNGLLPQKGERAQKLGEEEDAVYLFSTYEACEEALCNWLGEEFEDLEEELVTLKVELPEDFPLEQIVEWEMVAKQIIEPRFITFYKNEG